LEKISIVFSIFLSVSSLVIAILSYRLKIPKIKIQIMNKETDCFFGNVRYEHNGKTSRNRISGVRLRLINNSPSEISVINIILECNKETYRLIDNSNDYWEIVEFVFPDEKGEEITDGSAIFYGNEGISLPLRLSGYEGKDIIALFHHFPMSIKKQAKAKVIIQTAVGVKTKRVKLREYDEDYINYDYMDYLQYCRSTAANEEAETVKQHKL